jgi:hypothetical protein
VHALNVDGGSAAGLGDDEVVGAEGLELKAARVFVQADDAVGRLAGGGDAVNAQEGARCGDVRHGDVGPAAGSAAAVVVVGTVVAGAAAQEPAAFERLDDGRHGEAQCVQALVPLRATDRPCVHLRLRQEPPDTHCFSAFSK